METLGGALIKQAERLRGPAEILLHCGVDILVELWQSVLKHMQTNSVRDAHMLSFHTSIHRNTADLIVSEVFHHRGFHLVL